MSDDAVEWSVSGSATDPYTLRRYNPDGFILGFHTRQEARLFRRDMRIKLPPNVWSYVDQDGDYAPRDQNWQLMLHVPCKGGGLAVVGIAYGGDLPRLLEECEYDPNGPMDKEG